MSTTVYIILPHQALLFNVSEGVHNIISYYSTAKEQTLTLIVLHTPLGRFPEGTITYILKKRFIPRFAETADILNPPLALITY